MMNKPIHHINITGHSISTSSWLQTEMTSPLTRYSNFLLSLRLSNTKILMDAAHNLQFWRSRDDLMLFIFAIASISENAAVNHRVQYVVIWMPQ